MQQIFALIQDSLDNLIVAAVMIAPAAAVFIGLAFATKGKIAVEAARQAADEIRINLWLHVLDTVIMLPLLAIVVGAIDAVLLQLHLSSFQQQLWLAMGPALTVFFTLFLGDFEGYWRHRFEHTRLVWPTHAIHHSDTEMNWLTLDRFHPVNRITTTALDSGFLSLMGFPAWAIMINLLVRHYYGYFIHADVPWTYGRLSKIFVSPAMHQWHHARDIRYAGTNFATLFSVFDLAFGTYRGGICDVPLGLDYDMGKGVSGQLAYPFRAWAKRWRERKAGGTAASPGTGRAGEIRSEP